MKNLLLIFSLVSIYSFAQAQPVETPKTPFTKMYLSVWLEAKKHCLEVAEDMAEP